MLYVTTHHTTIYHIIPSSTMSFGKSGQSRHWHSTTSQSECNSRVFSYILALCFPCSYHHVSSLVLMWSNQDAHDVPCTITCPQHLWYGLQCRIQHCSDLSHDNYCRHIHIYNRLFLVSTYPALIMMEWYDNVRWYDWFIGVSKYVTGTFIHMIWSR